MPTEKLLASKAASRELPASTYDCEGALTDDDMETILEGLVKQLEKRKRACKDIRTTDGDVFRWRNEASGVCPYDLYAFIERISKYSLASPPAFIVALGILDRLVDFSMGTFVIAPCNQHLLILVAVMVGSKLIDDRFASNKRYAEIGGQTKKDLNAMEACTSPTVPPESSSCALARSHAVFFSRRRADC